MYQKLNLENNIHLDFSQGILSVFQGNSFLSGALSGGLGSWAASGFGAIAGDWAGKAGGQIFFGALAGGVGAELTGGNFWQGAVTGGIVAGLNHAMHKMAGPGDKNRAKNKKKVIGTTKEAVDHYYNGKGEEVELSWDTKKKLFISDESKYVIKRLVNGQAIKLSATFDVDLTNSYETFHVGDTNVDYSTTCTTGKCTTTFRAFVRDSFSDPLDIGIEIGGTPYKYSPWEYSFSYKNPGYPVGSNLKINTNR